MKLEPAKSREWREVYRLLTALVLPRPIAWVSTYSESGEPNVAPFSFFNVVCAKPPTLVVCPMWSGPDALKKDTVRNIEQTGEFVTQVVSRRLVEKMNLTSCEVSSEVNEFEVAGLTLGPSVKVGAPRVVEASAHMECRLDRIIQVGDEPGGGCLILGEVVFIDIDEKVMAGNRVDIAALDPVARLAGSGYCGTRDYFELDRPTLDEVGRPGRQ